MSHGMDLTELTMVLIAWPLIGIGAAWLFGRAVQIADFPENAGRPSAVVRYLRRSNRSRKSNRETVDTRSAAGSARRR
jgi:hypothetical protein